MGDGRRYGGIQVVSVIGSILAMGVLQRDGPATARIQHSRICEQPWLEDGAREVGRSEEDAAHALFCSAREGRGAQKAVAGIRAFRFVYFQSMREGVGASESRPRDGRAMHRRP